MANYTYTWAKKHFSALLGKGTIIPHQSIRWTFGDVEVSIQYVRGTRQWHVYVTLTEECDSTWGKYKQSVDHLRLYPYHFGYKVYKGHEYMFGYLFGYLKEPKLEELAKSGEWEMALLIAKGQNII